MYLFVKTSGGTIITLQVEPFFTVKQVKEVFETKTGILVIRQYACYGARILDNEKSLDYYGIYHEYTLGIYKRISCIGCPGSNCMIPA
jgi:hypothetical protein